LPTDEQSGASRPPTLLSIAGEAIEGNRRAWHMLRRAKISQSVSLMGY